MNRVPSLLIVLSAMLCLTAFPPHTLLADGGGGGGGGGGGDAVGSLPGDPDVAEAYRLIEKERYAQAEPLLNKALAKDARNADAYNLLGYSARRQGRFEEALRHYQSALSIDPEHKGAHEYMGEAYLELGQPDKAREHLTALDDICWLWCREYAELKEAIAQYESGRRS